MQKSKNATVISVKNLSKVYKLYDKKKDRMKEALNPFSKKYSELFYALKNVSFDINKGEILGIVGRNGAGKSTLLEIITGVLSKTSGVVHTKGRISALLSLGIGFNPLLTGVENIYLNGTLQGFSRKEISEKVDDILEFADIGRFAYQQMKTYSSGMSARLGFAVAINIDPDILIVDEALAVGDSLFKRKCFAKIENFMNMGKTIILVTHSMNNIIEFCTRAILIDQGELILEGSPRLIASQYEKFLFSSNEKLRTIREEIVKINRDQALKMEMETIIDTSGSESKEGKPALDDPDSLSRKIHQNEKISKPKPMFIPNFVPKSTSESREFDVDLFDLRIRTISGEDVNVLVTGEEYIASYKVHFNFDCDNVDFGIRFKTLKGQRVASFSFNKGGEFSRKIKSGDKFLLSFKFNCNFLRKIYLIDCWVTDKINGEKRFLNYVSDLSIFKIEKQDHTKNSAGIVYIKPEEVNIKSITD